MRDNNKHWEEEEDKRAWTLSVEEEEEQPEGPDTAQLLSHHSAAYLIRIQAATVLQLTVRTVAADLPGPLWATMAPDTALIQLCISSGLSACRATQQTEFRIQAHQREREREGGQA